MKEYLFPKYSVMRKTLSYLFVSALIGMPAFHQTAHAQTSALSGSNEPVEIIAEKTLEWRRNDNKFVATGNAIAKQGTTSIAASVLTADYRDSSGDDTGLNIWQVTADDDVIIHSEGGKIFGQKGVYDLDSGYAVMTGNDLRMESPDQTVTAKDSFEYWTDQDRFVAKGNATVIRQGTGGQNTLTANKLTALLKQNAEGKRVLDTLEATDNVVITSPTETVTGSYGIYRAGPNIAELTGIVTIKRGPNTLEGKRAIVDLNTNTSTLFGAADSGDKGRVRGIFYPGSEKKPE